MRTRSVLLPLLLLSLAACAAQPAKTIVVPPGRERAYDEWHYAPAIRVGDTVIVSGIPAAPGDDYDSRVRSMFERLKKTLEASGATLADVVEIDTFHAQAKDTASFNAEFARFSAIHHEYFPQDYPAWTAVGTTALLADGAPVEMRAVAVVGAGRKARVQRATAPPAR